MRQNNYLRIPGGKIPESCELHDEAGWSRGLIKNQGPIDTGEHIVQGTNRFM
jgi:hypothetical protein